MSHMTHTYYIIYDIERHLNFLLSEEEEDEEEEDGDEKIRKVLIFYIY